MEGSDASMRVSSVILPSFNGTLKSTRMKARWPERFRSVMDSLFITLADVMSRYLRTALLHDELYTIPQPNAEAPLIVVPGKHLQHPVADGLGQRTIDDRRMGIVEKVSRHEFFLGVLKDALQRAIRCGLQRRICRLDRHGLRSPHREVDQRNVRRWNAN